LSDLGPKSIRVPQQELQMSFVTDRIHELGEHQDRQTATVAHPDPAEITARLNGRILGQPTAVDAAVRALTLARAGLTDPSRPLANLLFVGPTGVGKTELVRRIAAEIRSGPDDMCRIDMNALAQEHYAASLSGAPPGYSGSKESHTLFDRATIEGDLYRPGIVLFDEVEKADATVLKALLQVLDHGELRLANGQHRISFRNSFVFLTSNLGSRDVARLQQRRRRYGWTKLTTSRTDHSSLIRAALERFFDPEFFNRIDETVVFETLSQQSARAVTVREVRDLTARLRQRSVNLIVDDSVVDLLVRYGFDPVYGARGLKRAIRLSLADPIARQLISINHRGVLPLDMFARAQSDGRGVAIESVVPTSAPAKTSRDRTPHEN
jgi:ATP-dependent Clp protease ATP-binding subunit ClpA